MLVITIVLLIYLVSSPALMSSAKEQIYSHSFRQRRATSCILPPVPEHGSYTSDVPVATPGQSFQALQLNVTCLPGYGLVGSPDVICYKGIWSQTEFPYCIRFCKLEEHPSVHYHCLIQGTGLGERPCKSFEPSGTIVRPECNRPNYYSSEILSFMRCIDGHWDYIARCTPECGRITPGGIQLVAGGHPAKRGELPWHTAIYAKTFNPYMNICGGTLVTNSVTISAAHCFYGAYLQPASDYVVAAGKLYRPYVDSMDDIKDTQKSDVRNIKIPSRFQGRKANFQDDIALLYLEQPFTYQTHVRPVCLDFDYDFDRRQLVPGNMGKVAGWGLTAVNGPASPILKVLEMPYIDISYCISKAPPAFGEYITSDKICAGYENKGTAVCQGDSGGGLVFPATDRGIERYYLRGVVSTAPDNGNLCNTQTLTTFTQVIKHEHFIKENLYIYNRDGSYNCRKNEWACDDGACIPLDKKCNGIVDCPDSSDEVTSLCGDKNQLKSSSSGCVLPPAPKYGSFVSNVPLASSGQSFPSIGLNVTCLPGYKVEGNSGAFCFNGVWSGLVPECVPALNQEASCQWNGVEGTCVESSRCLTSFHDKNDEKHPVCSKNDKDSMICCTDCKLLNVTSTAVTSAKEKGQTFKDGERSRYHCLRYLKELPYNSCGNVYDSDRKCHNYSLKGASPLKVSGTTPPYQALLWKSIRGKHYSGTIISEKFILTSAWTANDPANGVVDFVALGVKNRTGSEEDWQILRVKRIIKHPENEHPSNDLALLETETPIQFNENVLPACLPAGELDDDEAYLTTWVMNHELGKPGDVIRKINVQKYTKQECIAAVNAYYQFLPYGYYNPIHSCYGHRQDLQESCRAYSGDPLVVDSYISSCIQTIIGMEIYNPACKTPSVYSKLSYYVPWIESVVWP